MDTMTRQIGDDIKSGSNVTEGMVKCLEEQLLIVQGGLSDKSSLYKQLSASEERSMHLQTKLEVATPALEKLGLSINGLRDREVDLGQRMEGLEARLAEVKLPERFEDDYFHISEKLKLENEVQQLYLKLESTKEKLEAQHLDGEKKQDDLREMTARAHKAEKNAMKLEEHTDKLQEAIEEKENEAQESINRAVASVKDKCSAEFERRQHELLMEKVELEGNAKRAKEKLVESQRKLVTSYMASTRI